MGHLVQESSGGNPRRDNSGADGNSGLVQGTAGSGLETYFPITPKSIRLGNLPLEHKAWTLTPNPWWKFLADVPKISWEVVEDLNRQRRPFVVPYWDESGWIIQERKLVDFRGMATAHMGNHPTLKLIQIMALVQKCNVLSSCRKDILGILKYMLIWKPY